MKNTKIKYILSLICVVGFFFVPIALYGAVGLGVMLGVIFDVPTLITLIVARYARYFWHVMMGVLFACFIGEAILTLVSPSHEISSGVFFRLAGQSLIAILVRIWFRSNVTDKKATYGFMILCIALLASPLLYSSDKSKTQIAARPFTDLEKRAIAVSSRGTRIADQVGLDASAEAAEKNR